MFDYFVRCRYGVDITTLIWDVNIILLHTDQEFRKARNNGQNCEEFN